MRLDGIHHISCITGDARGNLDFYTRVMGLRLVAKTVNQDDPYVYHLFYADEDGQPGADLTFFEYPHATPGRSGSGMVHRITLRVASEAALDYWATRLAGEKIAAARHEGALRFEDPEGLGLELVAYHGPDLPLRAAHREIPAEFALIGFDSVRAYGARLSSTSHVIQDVLGGDTTGEYTWQIDGIARHGRIAYDAPPLHPGRAGAGTVHHVAWASEVADHAAWLERLHQHGISSTPIVDRFYFRSIYFREPSGVLFELATKGPGFTIDSPVEQLGRRLILPPAFEPRRAEIEPRLTPLPDPRAGW
ncbi:MAG TPA: VOC family protein [Gemmatimonadales bacterium]|jgi:glyoxalase family protein|nr:VOC family protein [Gemmatimonadales bacterium]